MIAGSQAKQSPLPKAITFSLTRDRVFGEDQIAK